MATLASLRGTLRSQLGDIAKLSKERRFENEYLEGALFDGMWQHSKGTSWDKLHGGEEQLVLLLAKSRIAKDKSLEYALDPKLQAGSGFSREKLSNASMLAQLASDYRQEYEDVRRTLFADPDSDITVTELVRKVPYTRALSPMQAAKPPVKPRIHSVNYKYDSYTGAGTILLEWDANADSNTAFIRIYAGSSPDLYTGEPAIIRTVYDFWGDMGAYSPNRIAQKELHINKTLLPTGVYYVIATSHNWNMLVAESDPATLVVTPYLSLMLDAFVQEAVS